MCPWTMARKPQPNYLASSICKLTDSANAAFTIVKVTGGARRSSLETLSERSIRGTIKSAVSEFDTASNAWIARNIPEALKAPGLTARYIGRRPLSVSEGEFALGPTSVPLETNGLRTCVGGTCVQGDNQLLFHAREMDHFTAIQEAIQKAGIDLSKADTTLLPGPYYGRTLANILPAFMQDGRMIGATRVIPFKGTEPGGFVLHNGSLFAR